MRVCWHVPSLQAGGGGGGVDVFFGVGADLVF